MVNHDEVSFKVLNVRHGDKQGDMIFQGVLSYKDKKKTISILLPFVTEQTLGDKVAKVKEEFKRTLDLEEHWKQYEGRLL